MSRWIALLVLIIFVTWIIPLGAFVTAAQEKKICNGRRAVCLCTNYAAKKAANDLIDRLKRPRRSAEEALTFPSFGTNFVLVEFDFSNKYAVIGAINSFDALFDQRLKDPPREPVPKSQFSV